MGIEPPSIPGVMTSPMDPSENHVDMTNFVMRRGDLKSLDPWDSSMEKPPVPEKKEEKQPEITKEAAIGFFQIVSFVLLKELK